MITLSNLNKDDERLLSLSSFIVFYTKKYTFPNDKQLSEVVDKVYEKIEEAGIWVPYGEVLKHYKSKRSNVNKRVKRLFNEKGENYIDQACFMNMCMICDNAGNVLALDKVNDSYTGTTFPGGHVEKNEIFNDSVIREVWEETGIYQIGATIGVHTGPYPIGIGIIKHAE